jgi:hypothetical protein
MYNDGSSKFSAGCPCTHPFYGIWSNYLTTIEILKFPPLLRYNLTSTTSEFMFFIEIFFAMKREPIFTGSQRKE